ncbi:MAG: ATP-binding cassette domain-containing protein, partial [Candidatus Hydrogenedentes bacterium]|nr:ATP-binding cassette domain-containing protein [Candidatus Hydrogenedentota bacterium]
MFCECRDILVRYDKAAVLDVKRLDIPSGKISAIVGANGAGKTTLLEVMALLRRPVRGSIRLWGREGRTGNRELQSKVVMVMHPGYMFRGTVWDNVMYGLKARGVTRKEALNRVEEALKLVGMENFGH